MVVRCWTCGSRSCCLIELRSGLHHSIQYLGPELLTCVAQSERQSRTDLPAVASRSFNHHTFRQ
jgi:hypothetical protein